MNGKIIFHICIIFFGLVNIRQQLQIKKLEKRVCALEDAALTEHQRNIINAIEWMLKEV